MDVLIVAAGKGTRVGGELPKQYILLDDKPVLFYSILPFIKNSYVQNIYVVIHKDHIDLYENFEKQYSKILSKLKKCIIGGERRQDSVLNGLETILKNNKSDLVAIHDAARPFLSQNILNELIEKAQIFGSSAPGLLLTDTIKIVDEENRICEHPIRKNLRRIQTPQIFNFNELYKCYQESKSKGIEVTDDTEIFTLFGNKTIIIDGSEDLFKITYQTDIETAKEKLWKYTQGLATISTD